MSMTSSRPYIIRALYEWILDNDLTPYIVAFADAPDVAVPLEFVNKEGQIVLNISPSAIRDLDISNRAVSFNARFGGVPTDIYVPSGAVLGIYARENGQGMMFELESTPEPEPPEPSSPESDAAARPSLRIVK